MSKYQYFFSPSGSFYNYSRNLPPNAVVIGLMEEGLRALGFRGLGFKVLVFGVGLEGLRGLEFRV